MNKILGWLKKAYDYIMHDESLLAWFLNVLIAFLLIKFVVFPILGFMLGTPLPLVAVVSGSMDHGAENGMLCGQQLQEDVDFWDVCGEWYEQRNISEQEFEEFPFDNGFSKGDIMLLKGVNPDKIALGDVVVYEAQKPYPIIHRVVQLNSDGTFQTRGDHNAEQIVEYVLRDGRYFYRCYSQPDGEIRPSLCGPGSAIVDANTPGAFRIMDETRVHTDQVMGKAIGRVPYVGYVKIWFVNLIEFVTGTART